MTLAQEMDALSNEEFLSAMSMFVEDPPDSDHQLAYLRLMISKAVARGICGYAVVTECRKLTMSKLS